MLGPIASCENENVVGGLLNGSSSVATSNRIADLWWLRQRNQRKRTTAGYPRGVVEPPSKQLTNKAWATHRPRAGM